MTQPRTLSRTLQLYSQLMRLDRPIGIYLLLWPTLWALWLAAGGFPTLKNFLIFCLGVILMRSAGCVINDYADRHLDRHVERTKERPLTSGKVREIEALGLFAALCTLAFALVCLTNQETLYLSFGGLFLAALYPFMKRYTYLPQVFLGAAFAWAIPMAYMAQTGSVESIAWLLYTATVVWTVAYDTIYAMVDREDDIKIGIKSTAILFGTADKAIIALLQTMTVLILISIGVQKSFGLWYFLGVALGATLFIYLQHLIRYRRRELCFQAFLNNHYFGLLVFIGLVFETWPSATP